MKRKSRHWIEYCEYSTVVNLDGLVVGNASLFIFWDEHRLVVYDVFGQSAWTDESKMNFNFVWYIRETFS